MSRAKSFTLVESLTTLFVISIILASSCCFLQKRPAGVSHAQWEQQFDAYWQSARSRALSQQKVCALTVASSELRLHQCGRQVSCLALPAGYRFSRSYQITLLESGYVKPQTLVGQDPDGRTFHLIFSFGGGQYRWTYT